jgi:8-oxo-dGTP diphosphatase
MIKSPFVTADVIILAEDGEILLIRRLNPPFQGHWALPGGFIDTDMETIEECAVREAREETCLEIELDRLLGVWSKPGRDPRGHTLTCVYLTKAIPVSRKGEAQGSDDAEEAMWIHPAGRAFEEIQIAFDHREIIQETFGSRKDERK